MIDKVKATVISGRVVNIDVNPNKGQVKGNGVGFQNKATVENFDFNSMNGQEQSYGESTTNDVFLSAIKDNFYKNREVTTEMNNRVYEGFQRKFAQYMANSGRDNK